MERRGKGSSGGEWHVAVGRIGVEVRVNIVIVGVIGVVGIKTGVLEIVGVIWM